MFPLLIFIYYSKDIDYLNVTRFEKHKLEKQMLEYRHFENISVLKYFSKFVNDYHNLPIIYMITPTYYRDTQLPDLIRLRNTLLQVPKLVWIIVEDSNFKTKRIKNFLQSSMLDYVHLNTPTLKLSKIKDKTRHKGVEQRNHAIVWLRKKFNEIEKNGVVYFGDDDNTYDLRLFEEVVIFETKIQFI